MNHYEEKKQARIDYYREKAAEASKESDQLFDTAEKMLSIIPPGQPIIVGHYSEKRDRNYRAKIDRKMQKSVEASSKADYYAEKAAAAESNTAISSDDPEAITKLEDKLNRLIEKQDKMKRINAYYRKHGTCIGCDLITREEAVSLNESMKSAYSWETAPFASFTLSNNSAVIRQTKNRIEKLKEQHSLGYVGWEFDGGKAVANNGENRLQLFFDSKPTDAQRTELKNAGFHWSGYNKAWQRQLNDKSIYAASRVSFIQPINGDSIVAIQPKRKKHPEPER